MSNERNHDERLRRLGVNIPKERENQRRTAITLGNIISSSNNFIDSSNNWFHFVDTRADSYTDSSS